MRRIFLSRHFSKAPTPEVFRIIWTLAALIFVLALAGCATTQAPSDFKPQSINEVRFRDRMQTKLDGEVRVPVAVPTAAEAAELFQANLIGKEIQPVWVKIENHSNRSYYFISTAADPNYFSPLEAAYAVRRGLSQADRNAMEHYFRQMRFQNPILPDTAVSGFIFTNLDEGEKWFRSPLLPLSRLKFLPSLYRSPECGSTISWWILTAFILRSKLSH